MKNIYYIVGSIKGEPTPPPHNNICEQFFKIFSQNQGGLTGIQPPPPFQNSGGLRHPQPPQFSAPETRKQYHSHSHMPLLTLRYFSIT